VTQIAASVTTSLGLNHGALQIGPYYVHYTTLNFVTFHDIEQKGSSFAMLYPHQDFSLQPEQLLGLCQAIVNFNLKQYDDRNNNCHHFVDAVLTAIKCPPFPTKGPIANFLDMVRWSNTGINHMRIRDLHNNLQNFESYEGFRKYCQQDEIKRIISTSPSNITEEQQQYLQVLRAVERGFQIQQPLHKQIPKKDLIFNGGDESSLLLLTDKITKFNIIHK